MSCTARSAVTAIQVAPERGQFLLSRFYQHVLTNDRFVEYETAADLASAVEKLDNNEFKGSTVRCISDVRILLKTRGLMAHTYHQQPQTDIPRPRERYRSRSPGYRGRGYGGPPMEDDYYGRAPRGPPRGYSPRREDGYRRRTPPPPRGGGYYDDPREDRGYGPPRGGRGPPVDEYAPPARGGYPDERYGAPPPRRGGYEPDPYMNGHGREPYARPPRSPPRDGRAYERGYEARPYW